MTTEEDAEKRPKPAGRRRKVARSPTPPSAEEFLEKRAVRVLVKLNGKQQTTSKLVTCDFNLDYDDFCEFFHPVLYRKAGAIYDPMAYKNLKLKYAFVTQARLGNIGKQPMLETEYTDLDEEHDYEALQLDLQQKARNAKSETQLVLYATIVTESASASPKSTPEQPVGANLNDGESNRNQVLFPFLIFC
jgi:hypothetical protein